MSARKWILQGVGGGFAVLLVSGCAMMDSMAAGGSSNDTRYTYLEDRIKTLTERVAGLEQANANLQRDVSDLRAQLGQTQGGASASELQQLRDRVQTLEAQREKDRQAILDQVAREIAGVAGSRKSSAPSASSGSGNDVGYEHVVEKGQTLTDIAKAYGVSVAAIKKGNNLKNDNIFVGQKLFIPKK